MTLDLVLSDDSNKEITKNMIKMSFQKTHLLYDKNGERKLNSIYNLLKSLNNIINIILFFINRTL